MDVQKPNIATTTKDKTKFVVLMHDNDGGEMEESVYKNIKLQQQNILLKIC